MCFSFVFWRVREKSTAYLPICILSIPPIDPIPELPVHDRPTHRVYSDSPLRLHHIISTLAISPTATAFRATAGVPGVAATVEAAAPVAVVVAAEVVTVTVLPCSAAGTEGEVAAVASGVVAVGTVARTMVGAEAVASEPAEAVSAAGDLTSRAAAAVEGELPALKECRIGHRYVYIERHQ